MNYDSKRYSHMHVNFLHFQQQELKKIIFLTYCPPIFEVLVK